MAWKDLEGVRPLGAQDAWDILAKITQDAGGVFGLVAPNYTGEDFFDVSYDEGTNKLTLTFSPAPSQAEVDAVLVAAKIDPAKATDADKSQAANLVRAGRVRA